MEDKKTRQNRDIKNVTLCAIMIALATVLSCIKFDMPLGGGVTLLSMVPIAFISCMLGLKWGFGAAFVYSLVQLYLSFGDVLSWAGLTTAAIIGTFIFDYIVPYTMLGICGIFRKKGAWGVVAGVAIGTFIRFVCHFFTGVLIFDIWCEWDNVWLYSLCYNGGYMLPEIVLTCVGTAFLCKSKAISRLVLNA